MTQRLYIEDIASRLEARPDVYATAAANLLRSLAKDIDTTKQAKEDIAAAWCAGYYHAGYTYDGAYADKMSDEFAAEWCKKAAQPVGINGLTDAETSASMSVVGLSKPKVAQPAHAPAQVCVERGRVWIKRGVQSFMLAYEDDENTEWYANQLRKALSIITPDVKIPAAPSTKEKRNA